jgi:hypothetical protein
MNKKITILFLAAVLLAVCPMSLKAQEQKEGKTEKKEKKKSKFGSFVKKVGEQTTGINMTDEPFAVIPALIKRNLDVEFVECVGDRASETVMIAFTAKSKRLKADFRVGGRGMDKAYDKSGNSFNNKSAYTSVDKGCPNGIAVRYEVTFKSVPATLEAFELVSIAWWLNVGNDKGASGNDNANMEFRNIPIAWE